MYPVSTSFIPLTVALAKFIVEGGSVWGNYPYWYLGEVPFRYLIGPVVPTVILGLDRLFGGSSLFGWSLVLIVAAWAVAALGWGILAWLLSGSRKVGVLVGVFSLVLPWHVVSSLALSETSAVLASSFGPWVLFAFAKFQIPLRKFSGQANSKFQILLPAVAFGFLLLVNTVASIPTMLGLGILAFVLYKHPTEGLKRAGLVVFLGGLLTLWWYDPGYWLKILFAPSFGGRSVIGALLHVVDLARTLLPVALAFIVVVWKVKPKNNFEKFAYLWLGSFIGLTLVRFVANVHFWLDWTSWFGEIEVGLVLVLAGFLSWDPVKGSSQPTSSTVTEHKLVDHNSNVGLRALAGTPSALATPGGVYPERQSKGHVFEYFKPASLRVGILFLAVLVFAWILAFSKKDFWMPRKNIENTVEYKIAKWLETNSVNCEPALPAGRLSTLNCPTVFLSGTSAFWLNALVDVRQVRGGVDQVGLRPELAKTVWEVRMGSSGEQSVIDLKKLGVNYLVVHSNYSKEFYHDFENPGKFDGLDSFVKVYDENGDIIYRINER